MRRNVRRYVRGRSHLRRCMRATYGSRLSTTHRFSTRWKVAERLYRCNNVWKVRERFIADYRSDAALYREESRLPIYFAACYSELNAVHRNTHARSRRNFARDSTLERFYGFNGTSTASRWAFCLNRWSIWLEYFLPISRTSYNFCWISKFFSTRMHLTILSQTLTRSSYDSLTSSDRWK